MYFLRVNMDSLEVNREKADEEFTLLGGRALTSTLIKREISANCDPLGSKNKLIIAPGLLGGSRVSSCNRLSIGAKSPLTGGIKEANGGGIAAMLLARMGTKAIIVEGVPREGGCYILKVEQEGAKLILAPELQGLGLGETASRLRQRYGKTVGIIANGPAGEERLLAAAIANNDRDGRLSRFCARGGMGAVMGSKGLKAVVIEDLKLPARKPQHTEPFAAAVKEFHHRLLTVPQTAEIYPKYGTSSMVSTLNELRGLPTRNFRTGSFEGAEEITGYRMYEIIKQRGGEGKTTHACMPGCLIRCSNVYPDEDGKEIVSPVEYETIGLMGSNLGIDNLDVIAKLNWICNDLGLDTIEIGAALGVAMDIGVLSFGDAEAAYRIVSGSVQGEILGRLIACGAEQTGKVLGSRRVPVAKGQSMAAYDPRAIKGTGVTYATSPMGADHTAGTTARMPLEHSKPEGQTVASKNAQINSIIWDTCGLCMFCGTAMGGKFDIIAKLLASFIGIELDEADLKDEAKKIWLLEREYNRQVGREMAADRLPEFFYEESNPDLGCVFDVPDNELRNIEKL